MISVLCNCFIHPITQRHSILDAFNIYLLNKYFKLQLFQQEPLGLSQWVSDKEPPATAGDMGSIPGSGRFPGERNGNPLQYSYLENPMDRGIWRATVHGITKSWTQLHNLATNPPPPLERMYQAVQSRQHKPTLCILNEKPFNKGDLKVTSLLTRLGSRRQHGHSRLSRNPKVQKLQVSCCQLPLLAGASTWMSLRRTTGNQEQASYLKHAIPHVTPTLLSED